MKVTPDMEVPIMAMETKYHGDLRLPIKKVSLLALREVKYEITKSVVKYPIITVIMRLVDIPMKI